MSQPLLTKNKQIEVAITFSTGYNRIFIVSNKNNILYFTTSITDKNCFIQITIPPGAYELESLIDENKKVNFEEKHFPKQDKLYTIKTNSFHSSYYNRNF